MSREPTTRKIACPTCGAPAGKPCRSVKSNKPLPDDHASRRQTLISVRDAVKMGHTRLRLPRWSNPMDHIKIDIIDGKLGPWVHLFAPFNKECNGRDPVDLIWLTAFPNGTAIAEFEVYAGPLPESAEYQAAVRAFEGCMK